MITQEAFVALMNLYGQLLCTGPIELLTDETYTEHIYDSVYTLACKFGGVPGENYMELCTLIDIYGEEDFEFECETLYGILAAR